MSDLPQRITPSGTRARRRGSRARWITQFAQADFVTRTTAAIATGYLRLVQVTSTMEYEPGSPFVVNRDILPGIGTIWHGHNLILPLLRPEGYPVRVIISNHRDGTIFSIVARRFGVGTIRGSGGREPRRWLEKGAVTGFLGLRASLEEGYNVCMTADISNGVARQAGLGIVALAKATGRPILELGLAASRRVVFNSWDRAVLALPFSRIVCVVAPPIGVPADADDAVMEAKRRALEDALNAATDRAYAIADRRAG